MDTYDKTSHVVSRAVTQQFSSSFSLASRLFPVPTRQAIYDIYGLVRVADEIVDSYRGQDSRQSIDDFEGREKALDFRGGHNSVGMLFMSPRTR